MIAEIFPQHYDINGHSVFSTGTRERRMGFHRGSMSRYLADKLEIPCKDINDIRRFLNTCRVRRRKDISRRDHWQSPHEFEKARMGNCVDFSLWTWRLLLALGYAARFVTGKTGKFGEGHAWVMFEQKSGKWCLLEPQRSFLGLRMPRISTLRYHPQVSVGCTGKKVLYFEHEDRNTEPALRDLPGLVAEWLFIWFHFWTRLSYRLPLALAGRAWARARQVRVGR